MAAKNPSNQLEKTTIICYFQKLIYIIFWPTLHNSIGNYLGPHVKSFRLYRFRA